MSHTSVNGGGSGNRPERQHLWCFGILKIIMLLMYVRAGSSGEKAKDIPLPSIRSEVLAKVVEFCQQNHEDPMTDIPKVIQHSLVVCFFGAATCSPHDVGSFRTLSVFQKTFRTVRDDVLALLCVL